MEQNPRFRILATNDSRSRDLVQEIVEKARGVFLWVVLVVKSLLTGLGNADRVIHLQKRLRSFPESLEKYFGHMLISVEQCYREETAKAFNFALVATAPMSLMTYSFLDDFVHEGTTTPSNKVLTMEDILSRQDDMRRRLNGRCKGLLEVTSSGDSETAAYIMSFPKVDFLHRTVRDFLLTKDVQNLLSQSLEVGFEPRVHICKALLHQLKCFDYAAVKSESKEPQSILEELVLYARELEVNSGDPRTSLMDEVGQIALEKAKGFVLIMDEFEYLQFLIRRRLNLYVAEVLTREAPLTASAYNQLLIAAILPIPIANIHGYDPQMVDLLLGYGATPNGGYSESTIWGQLLYELQRFFIFLEEETKPHLLQIIESLLSHGADPDLRVEVPKQKGVTRQLTGRAADLYKSNPVTKSAKQILHEQLGEEKAMRVLSKAQPESKSLLRSVTSWITRLGM